MQSLTEPALRRWIGEEKPSAAQTIGVIHGAAGPLDGFRLALAVWALGYPYVGVIPEESPSLVPTFARDVERRLPDLSIRFASREEALEQASAVLVRAETEDAAALVREHCEDHGIGRGRRLIQPPVVSVGLIDGHETDDERDRLAEDMLLFDGTGRRRVALLWAPRNLAPDPYLEAMARFRGAYPAHPDTPGTLQMQQAFLEAQDEPHAFAEDLQFLVSRGSPERKKAGHIRWVEYDDPSEGVAWVEEHREETYALVARAALHDQLSTDVPLRSPGGVHVPPLEDGEGATVLKFLAGLR